MIIDRHKNIPGLMYNQNVNKIQSSGLVSDMTVSLQHCTPEEFQRCIASPGSNSGSVGHFRTTIS